MSIRIIGIGSIAGRPRYEVRDRPGKNADRKNAVRSPEVTGVGGRGVGGKKGLWRQRAQDPADRKDELFLRGDVQERAKSVDRAAVHWAMKGSHSGRSTEAHLATSKSCRDQSAASSTQPSSF